MKKSHQKHKVLLVDDERFMLNALTRCLRSEKYDLLTASCGEDALHIIKNNDIYVIVSDEIMPGMTGVETLQKVKELSPNTYRILLTGYSGKESAIAAINKAGVHRYLSKPWEDDELREILREAVSQVELKRENERLFELTIRQNRELIKLNRAIEQSANSIIITDKDANIEYVNPAFTRLTGYRAEEVIGSNPRLLQSGETPQKEYEQLWKSITAGKEWQGELQNRRKNGELYWELTSISPIRDDEGNITNFLAVKEDATERRNTEEEMFKLYENLEKLVAERTKELRKSEKEMKAMLDMLTEKDEALEASLENLQKIHEELEHKNIDLMQANIGLRNAYEELMKFDQLKSEFVANVSHELRTPLTSIKSFSEILIEDIDDMEREQNLKYLGIIESECDRLARLINDLLDLRKIEIDADSWHDEELDLGVLLSETVDEFSSLVLKSGHYITTDLPEKAPLVIVDRDRIKQVIGNLISNALKFSDKGCELMAGIKVQNGTSLDSNEDDGGDDLTQVILFLADKGVGIPHEDQQRIFERFRQADGSATRKRGGAGLGLSICREIVEHYGGSIWVESEVGRGSTFYFSIPSMSYEQQQ